MAEVYAQLDEDNSGEIDVEELILWWTQGGGKERVRRERRKVKALKQKELEDFVDAVTSSGISSTYYEEMGRGGSPWEAAADAPGWRDPFEGMNDPAQIIVEVLKEVVGDLQ